MRFSTLRSAFVLALLWLLPVAALAQKPQLPDHVYRTLLEVCEAYPYDTVQSDAHLGEILNAVAWRHRDEGWGLSRKTGGKHVDSPVGPIAEDILQLPSGHHWDVLGGAGVGLRLQPGRGESIGVIDLRARPWVPPVEHTPSWLTGPPATPDAPPPPVVAPVPPAAAVDLSPILAALQRVEARLSALESRPAPSLDLFAAYVDDMVGHGPADDPALAPNHITDLKQRQDAIRAQLDQLTAWLRGRAVLRY